ncbi:MAG: SdiA-regulated domain-containing protein [Chitinispirillaceae bacterium]|nr:SdiA-regulated domain-containing protein [Chitinispirillaceae bacterium]
MPPYPSSLGFLFCLLLYAGWAQAAARSIAASLAEYDAVRRVSSVSGVSAVSFSGVSLHPATGTLYVIDNDNAQVYELDTVGNLLRTISTTGFEDPEGIAHQADDHFFIVEEGRATIVRLQLPRSGTGPVDREDGTMLTLAENWANSGLEGVSYNPLTATAYAVKETGPPRLYRITLDNDGNPVAAFPNDPFDIENKNGDAADVYALTDGNFIIVNQEQKRLEGYGPQGDLLSFLNLGMTKPEGVAIDTAQRAMYVVGEPREFFVFSNKAARIVAKSMPWASVDCSFRMTANTSGSDRIEFRLGYPSRVRIHAISLLGRCTTIFDKQLNPGKHIVIPPTGASPTGIRLYRFRAGP